MSNANSSLNGANVDDDCDVDDLTCPACGGSGDDWMESFMPCEECDGEGYRWWE